MTDIDLRPKVMNLLCYSGDTVAFTVTIPWANAAGKEWQAQVRSARDASEPDAEFTIVPPGGDGDPAIVTLASEDTKRLAGQAPVVRAMSAAGSLAEMRVYSGVYDVQISDGGSDPVNTLLQGSLTIELDVTRT
jgi:hypothetical protein